MINTNYYLAINNDGIVAIGRTNGLNQEFKPCVLQDGTSGKVAIAPANFIDSFRTTWIYRNSRKEGLTDKESFWLTKQAILVWIDTRKLSLLS